MSTNSDTNRCSSMALSKSTIVHPMTELAVALLTGGSDRPYVFGLVTELISKGVKLDLLGSDELDFPQFRNQVELNFLNLRRELPSDAGLLRKSLRVLTYYAKLIGYAATAKPKIFHILWNNKFEVFDRTVLMAYYRLLRKRIVLTIHNVNAAKRDRQDSALNRLTLRIQYHLAHRLFVHTEKMKDELVEEFGVDARRVTVIPFGINNAVPNSELTSVEAKQRLGLVTNKKTILSFGRITPYKGLEYVIAAFRQLSVKDRNYSLVIAGWVDRCEEYWNLLRKDLHEEVQEGKVLLKDDFVPDDQTEVYFKAADVLALAYTHSYQSGVLFLAHSFGLPVIASDVGSFRDEIVEGKTGFVFKRQDADDLARTLEKYFTTQLYADLSSRRAEIQIYARQQHSWEIVGGKTVDLYAELFGGISNKNHDRNTLPHSPLKLRTTDER